MSVRQWKDIWLNEGFATYAEWLWEEHTGGTTTAARFDTLYARPATAGFWNPPPGDPAAHRLVTTAQASRVSSSASSATSSAAGSGRIRRHPVPAHRFTAAASPRRAAAARSGAVRLCTCG